MRVFAVPTLVVILAGPASAQETPRPWQAGLDFGFNATRGTSRLTVFSGGFNVKRLDTRTYELELTGSMLYGESQDSVVARRQRGGLTFDVWPEQRVSPFLFVTAERDRFRRLDARTNTGGGVKYVLWREEGTSGSISGAVLHDYEAFSRPVTDGPRSRTLARWSVRGKADRTFDSGLALEHISWLQPVFNDVGDYNLDTTTKVSMRVTRRVGLNFTWNLRYDSTPPPGVRKDEQLLQAGLAITL